jgi:two-component sensor histidine kinase
LSEIRLPGPSAAAVPLPEDDFADAQLQMMELRHRTKNILAIVQSLVNQTLRGDIAVDEARKVLGERLMAMSKAVDVLMGSAWQSAPLDEVVAGALSHRRSFGTRIRIDGPEMPVGPTAAMTLSLALHELESNAIKYGALSNESGSVAVEWTVEQRDGADCLALSWIESGGPPVAPPTRTGFGTRLISRAIGKRLDGAAATDFHPEGLRWRLLASVQELAN